MTQAQVVAKLVLDGLALYAAAGVAVASAFLSLGVARLSPPGTAVSLGARLLLFPGAVGLWPVILRRWMAARRPR